MGKAPLRLNDGYFQHHLEPHQFKDYPNYWNFIQNHSLFNQYPLETLIPRFQDEPCVIVGAGPSLDKDLEDLVAYQGHYTTIVTEAALTGVLKAGLRPDAIISKEMDRAETHPEADNFVDKHFRGDLSGCEDIVLILSDCGSTKVAELWPGPIAFYYNKDLKFTEFWRHKKKIITQDLPQIVPRASMVGFHAVEVARFLGASKLALLGFDLKSYGEYNHHFGDYVVGNFPVNDRHDWPYYFAWSWFHSFFYGKFEMDVTNCSLAGRVTEEETDCVWLEFVEWVNGL